MRDTAIVVSTEANLAQVRVDCASLCHDCSAHSFCIGSQNKGKMSVGNRLSASPGDEVLIEVPDGRYNRALMLLFGTLLLGSLGGMILGLLLSGLLPLTASTAAPVGFFVGLAGSSLWLAAYFRRYNEKKLYPQIIDILNKGDSHE